MRALRSKQERALLYYSQNGKCAICGGDLPDDWHADHIVPYSVSGRTNVHEMQALCPQCNLQKGTKMLRKHQREMRDAARDVAGGAKVKTILAQVTPGGGKSALPPILAKEIAEPLGYKICWVVPRDALRKQSEKGFSSQFLRDIIGHTSRIRASGNDIRPTRGTIGYVTTYQAIAAAPNLHLQEFNRHRYILFLDECHHIPESGDGEEAAYYRAIAPLTEHPNCKLLVLASGTLERHDGKRIAFMPYASAINAETVDLSPTEERAAIRYSRGDALEEGAIVPLHFTAMDGNAHWLDPRTGDERTVSSIAESDARDQPAVLRTILETQYAYSLLDRCREKWSEYKNAVYQPAKMLVIAPTIRVARDYRKHLDAMGCAALIATSDDTPSAHRSIDRFKGIKKAGAEVDVLVTVGMAYEGLDVPQITHVACLTNIRSRPWIEQCICRANRTADGKTHGYIFMPDDPRMVAIVRKIEEEQAAVVMTWPPAERDKSDRASGKGEDIIFPVPISGDVTRVRGHGIEDGTRTDYNETELIENAMRQAHIKGQSVVQIKQMMAFMGASIVPNGAAAPRYDADMLTPSELEAKLRSSIDNTVGRVAHLTGREKRSINKELHYHFGPRGEADVKTLQTILRYLDETYNGVR